MKVKLFLALAALLIVGAQLYYSFGRKERGPESARTASATTGTAPSAPGSGERQPSAMLPGDVVAVSLSRPGSEDPVLLAKNENGWTVASLYSAPADAEKIDAFLHALLAAGKNPGDAAQPTGTAADEGVVALLTGADGRTAEFRIGTRPEGDYENTFVRTGEGGNVVLLGGDLRGKMGLWHNTADAAPESGVWAATRVLSFTPGQATEITALYPDHQLFFKRVPGEAWEMAGSAPGDAWSAPALEDWLEDLSDFRVAETVNPSEAVATLDSPTHFLDVTLADGTVKSVRACSNRSGDGMWVTTSEHQGQIFLLPMWRFDLYFQRMNTLFPDAAPSFTLGDIRSIDLKHGGESVKIVQRDGVWRTASIHYPLRREGVNHLARMLARWSPRDYADPTETRARPVYGSPLVEVVLVSGEVHRYRLGGRHPVFPWRYVVVDNATHLSADEADVAVLFPAFNDILEMGEVFPDIDADDVVAVDFSDRENGDASLRMAQNDDGTWNASSGDAGGVLDADEAGKLIVPLVSWRVTGFFEEGGMGGEPDVRYATISLASRNGKVIKITLLPPRGRNMPYIDSNGQAMQLGSSDFHGWLKSAAEISRRIREEWQKDAAPVYPVDSGSLPDIIGEHPEEGDQERIDPVPDTGDDDQPAATGDTADQEDGTQPPEAVPAEVTETPETATPAEDGESAPVETAEEPENEPVPDTEAETETETEVLETSVPAEPEENMQPETEPVISVVEVAVEEEAEATPVQDAEPRPDEDPAQPIPQEQPDAEEDTPSEQAIDSQPDGETPAEEAETGEAPPSPVLQMQAEE